MYHLWLRRGIAVVAAMAAALAFAPARAGKPKPPPPQPTVQYQYVSLGAGVALAINESGDVVGSGAFVALESTGYLREDLNDWISSDEPWLLSDATDINNLGQIVGRGRRYNGDGTYVVRSWRLSPWHVDVDGFAIVEDIGPTSQFAPVINDNGDVAGDGWLYTDDGGFLDVNQYFPSSILDRRVTGINNAAEIVGGLGGYPSGGQGYETAWRFTPQFDGDGNVTGGTVQSLGVIKANRGGIAQSTAQDINDLGQTAGSSTAGVNAYNAFRYTVGVDMQNLGNLGGGWVANQMGINSYGEVVGRDVYAGAFLYTDQFTMFALEPRVTNLPSNMVGTLQPCKINADGDICGGGGGNAFVLRRTAP